jgi:hypothetical protein
MFLLTANSSCQYQGSSHPASETATTLRTSSRAENAVALQPGPAEAIVELGPTTPARILAASNQAVIEGEGLKITLPTSLTLWCGWIGEIPIKIENSSTTAREVTLYARPPVNVFLGGKTIRPGQERGAIEVLRTTVAANEIKESALELQSLRVGKLHVPLSGLGQDVSFQLDSPVMARGAYFMYRSWFEGSEFFKPVWSNASQKLDAAQRRTKIREIAREQVRNGVKRDQAEREAKRILLEEFKPTAFELTPDWQEIYDQKKNSHAETYGFQYVDIDGLGWDQVERFKGQYDWTVGDFMLKLWADHFGAEPFVRVELPPEWTQFERGSKGLYGFFDPQNATLMNHWAEFCGTLAERYDGDDRKDAPGGQIIRHFILNNEPEGYWLNVDFSRDGWPSDKQIVTETDWWKDLQGQWGARAYAQKFGDLIYETTVRAARALHQANPQARVATPQFAPIGAASREMNDYLLKKGIASDIDAWGVHPGNNLGQLWQGNPQIDWWLEDARNQAPPFESDNLARVQGALDRKDQILSTVRPVKEIRQENPYMGKLWRKLIDEPFSRDLEELAKLFSNYQLDIPFWTTEVHEIGPLATNRRENIIAALREYSIIFHLKVEITVVLNNLGSISGSKVSPLPDPVARDIIIDIARAVGGTSPVAKFESQWFVRGENEYLDYRWVVYKLFNRGQEDILAIWSNSGKDEILDFELQSGAQISKISQTKFDGGESQFKETELLNRFPAQLMVKPLRQFYFISVTSDRPRFGWLKSIQRRVSPEEEELISQYHNLAKAFQNVRQSIRRGRMEGADRYRAIPRMLEQAEDNLIMGNFSQARQILDEINQMISRL